jgi:lantibiotic biosynthesis protein
MKYIPFKYHSLRYPYYNTTDLLEIFKNKRSISKYLFNPIFLEALLIASPELHNALTKLDKKQIEFENPIIISASKYLVRMATRSTPFGTFASTTPILASVFTDFLIEDPRKIKKKYKIDYSFIFSLYQNLLKDSRIYTKLNYSINNSSMIAETHIFYKKRIFDGKNLISKYIKININNITKIILDFLSENKQISYINLVDLLLNKDLNINLNMIESIINNLIIDQFLISELNPSLDGTNYINQLLEVFEKINDNHVNNWCIILKEIQKNLDEIEIDQTLTHTKFDKLLAIISQLNTNYELNRLINVESLGITNSNSIDIKSIINVTEIVSLGLLFSSNYSNSNMLKFKQKFVETYNELEVPLTDIFDPQTGIQYILGNTLIESNFNEFNEINLEEDLTAKDDDYTFNKIQLYLINAINTALKNNIHIIKLNENDIKEIEMLQNKDNKIENLPPTVNLMVKQFGPSRPNIGETKTQIIGISNSQSAASIHARFNSNILLIKEILDFEKNIYPEFLIAEVKFLAHPIAGNVINNSVKRPYEIALLCNPSKDSMQIPISDLTLSVMQDKIICNYSA